MPTFNRSSGVQLQLPSDIVVLDLTRAAAPAKPASPTSRGRQGLPTGLVPMLQGATPTGRPAPADAVVNTLCGQDMLLLDAFEIQPLGPAAPAGARAARDTKTQVAVELGEHEDAVLLLEEDGLYSWHFAAPSLTAHTPPTRRGPLVVPGRKRIVFDVDLQPSSAPATLRKRGPITDWFVGKVRGYVFKFVAQFVVGMAIKTLERNVKRGLVLIGPNDAANWKRVESLSEIALPAGRSARVLLFVHGTFSSTVGSYGALAATEWGKAFLKAARANYDLILGFDHATLSDDPLENATDLLARIESASWDKPPVIDAVAFSRGALVLRSLVEYLLHASPIGARVRRAIFVGGTNGGTQLAEPENWEFLVDLYTNLAVAGCRVLQMFPAATGAAVIMKESIGSLGALVKYMAAAALQDRVAPGLAAMMPSGEFVARINHAPPGQPGVFESFYCVITSEFDANLAQQGTELPAKLVRWLLDSAADQLMGGANDLIVDVDSMSLMDPQAGAFVKDRLDFGRNPNVYHTVYFTRPEVARALTRWLELDGVGVEGASRLARATPERPLGRPAMADENIMIASADAPFSEIARAIRTTFPSYVVLERHEGAKTYHYALAAEELIQREAEFLMADAGPTLRQALIHTPLELHEGSASHCVQIGEEIPTDVGVHVPTSGRTILFSGALPRAVVPAAGEWSSASLKVASERAARAAAPARRVTRGGPRTRGTVAGESPDVLDEIARRRTLPKAIAAVADPAARGDRYYFGAYMPEVVVVGKIESVTVTLSRDALAAVAGQISALGTGKVQVPAAGEPVSNNHMLILQVIPKTNVEVVGDDRFEMPPFTVERSTELMFDVRGTDVGYGELWVIVRQGPTKLVTLILKPQIVVAPAVVARNIRTAAESSPAEPLRQPLPILQIFERRNGDSLGYLFALDMGDGTYFKEDSPPFKGDRAAYVADMYKEIENRWVTSKSDVDAFNAELRAYGGKLFDQLIPSNIQGALWSVRDNLCAIHVLSEEPFIPWELVHLKPAVQGGRPQRLPSEMHFLGQKGLVRWLHNQRNAPLEIKVRAEHAYYAIPDYPHPGYKLPAAQEEIPFLNTRIKAQDITAEVNAIRKLLSKPGVVDLFHFSGHGEADTEKAAIARILLKGRVEDSNYLPDYFKSDIVEQYADLIGPDGNRPLIVLNACQVGRVSWQLTSIGGFAEAFLRAGAGVFLGTLWAVGDEPARTFTEAFYAQLLGGKPVSEATIAGRNAASGAGEATWLAYVVYGHPHAVVRFL